MKNLKIKFKAIRLQFYLKLWQSAQGNCQFCAEV